MSRGPGTVERAIENAFRTNPAATFTIEDLAFIAYPGVNRVEKKHRTAVLRAADKVSRRLWWQGRKAEAPGRLIVYLNLCDVRSYVIGLRRTTYPVETDVAVIERLIDDPTAHRSEWKDTQPGGAWWTHVEINKLYRDGRDDEAKAMHDAHNAKYAPLLRSFGAAIPRR